MIPRDKSHPEVVFATQVRGVVQSPAYQEMSGKMLRLWPEGETAASLGLNDGDTMFHVLSLGGRSPLCDGAETAEQNKLAMAKDEAWSSDSDAPPPKKKCCAVQ